MCWRKVAMSDYTTFFAPARPAKRFQNLCSRSSTGRAALQLDYLSVSVALKGHGFSHAVVSVESWASAPEGSRTSPEHRSSSVAKATINDGRLRHGRKRGPFKRGVDWKKTTLYC